MRAGIASLSAACLTAAGTFAGALFYAGLPSGEASALVAAQLESINAVPLLAEAKAQGRSWLERLGMRAAPVVDVTVPIVPLIVPLRGSLLDGEKPHVIPPQKSRFPFGTQ